MGRSARWSGSATPYQPKPLSQGWRDWWLRDEDDRTIPELQEFRGSVHVEEPFPLTFAEQYALTEATAELACACYAGVLLQAMGLGGRMFDGIDRFSMPARSTPAPPWWTTARTGNS